jgi:hypothetical protein
MKVERKNGKLYIEIDEAEELLPSSTGKTLVVASSHGNQPTGVTVNGQVMRIGVNAYIPAPQAPAGNGGGAAAAKK